MNKKKERIRRTQITKKRHCKYIHHLLHNYHINSINNKYNIENNNNDNDNFGIKDNE